MSEFKFLKTRGGITSFAIVAVQVTRCEEKSRVIVNIREPIDRGKGEVNITSHPDWVKAALEGALESLQFAEHSQKTTEHYLVEITKVVGLAVDTKEDALKCAAALATWQSLYPEDEALQPQFDTNSKKWIIQYPTRNQIG